MSPPASFSKRIGHSGGHARCRAASSSIITRTTSSAIRWWRRSTSPPSAGRRRRTWTISFRSRSGSTISWPGCSWASASRSSISSWSSGGSGRTRRCASCLPTRSARTIAGCGTPRPTRRWTRIVSAAISARSRRPTRKWRSGSAFCPRPAPRDLKGPELDAVRAHRHVMLKPGVLDPQGKAIAPRARPSRVRRRGRGAAGKVIEMEMAEADAEEARKEAEAMAEQLLANTVIESFSVTIAECGDVRHARRHRRLSRHQPRARHGDRAGTRVGRASRAWSGTRETRSSGLDLIVIPGGFSLRRLSARRRDGGAFADHGRGHARMRRAAAMCSASATASRS